MNRNGHYIVNNTCAVEVELGGIRKWLGVGTIFHFRMKSHYWYKAEKWWKAILTSRKLMKGNSVFLFLVFSFSLACFLREKHIALLIFKAIPPSLPQFVSSFHDLLTNQHHACDRLMSRWMFICIVTSFTSHANIVTLGAWSPHC
jgi:hypothetical protein